MLQILQSYSLPLIRCSLMFLYPYFSFAFPGHRLGANRKACLWDGLQPSLFGGSAFLLPNPVSLVLRHRVCTWRRFDVPYATPEEITRRACQILLGGNMPGPELSSYQRYLSGITLRFLTWTQKTVTLLASLVKRNQAQKFIFWKSHFLTKFTFLKSYF